MAIAPGSYSFMGGAVLGKGSEGQFVLVRSGSLLTTFTDEEYNACLEAVHDGKAVCVQYKTGAVTFQIQLLNVTGLGDLQFVDASVQSVTHYRVAGTSPHTVSIVKTGSAQQFVLERDDMSTAFTTSEYLQCQARISEGTALCVQWKSGSARMQAQLATILADGSLLFSHTTVDLETIFIVAGSDPHNITTHTNSLGGGGDQFVLVRLDMTSMFTNTEYQDCVDAVVAGKAVCVQYGNNQIQLGGIAGGALIFTQSAPDVITKYTVSPTTGSHTISAERIAVGVPIYASLQSAIADEAKLPIGTYFETNGFHASGDGGAGRYRVSSTGTADGINTILMSANKYAVLQRFDTVYPVEQSATESDLRLYATTSANTKINDSGSLVTDATFTLYRFDNLVPHSIVVIETDGNCAFSTGPSINDKVGDVIKKGANIVPPCGHWLLCSASNSYGVPKVRLYNNSAGAQAAKIAYGYDRLASAYNTSVDSGLDDYGTITSDASKTITRFNNLNEGDIVSVETDDKFIFSESASGTGRVGYPRKSGVYVVPKGISWMLVASSSSLAPVVNIIDRSTRLEDYGIRIYKSAIPSIRLGRAGNFSYSLNSARNAISDFDNCFPWNQMRVCNISISGGMKTVVYEGQAGFSYNNDTFVEVPAFYFKRVVHDTYEDWYVSNHGGDGFELEPWFKDGYGNKLAVRYVARFVHSNNGLSCVGQPTVVKPKSFFKTEFESNGFELMSIYGYQALQHLLVVELGTKNTQSIFNGVSNYKYIENSENIITSASGSTNYVEIAAGDVKNTYFAVGDQVVIFPTSSTAWGDGIVRTLTAFSYDSSVIKFTFDGAPISITSGVSSIFGCMQNNGKCNSVHTNGGMPSAGPTLTRPFLWRGIENLYGNLGEFVDLINYDFTATRLYVQGKYLTFKSPYRPNYIDGPTPSYIFSMGVDKNYPTLTLPEFTTTNPNSGYCDDWSTFGSGEDGDVVYGCAWDHLTGNGAFCLRAVTSGTNNLLYTGRAML